MTTSYLLTSESVSDGHPDKLADHISDTVLDRCLQLDPNAKVACETLITDGLVVVAGEFRLSTKGAFKLIRTEIDNIVRTVLCETGYSAEFPGIDPETCEVQIRIHDQSPQITKGVEREDGALGAGDQGLMFGYACDETPELMPLPIRLSHRLMQQHKTLRASGKLPWLCPDAKAQVTVRYEDDQPVAIDTIVISTQLRSDVSDEDVEAAIVTQLVDPIVGQKLVDQNTRCFINPAGRFEIGGPLGDTGLTGRKIIVDTYGGSCPHGGGAFSGKDPSKVDRSGAYMARWIAKNVVAAELARRTTVQLAYAIGQTSPVSIRVDTHGTATINEARIEQAVRDVFDLTPAGIIRDLDLLRPIYAATTAFGHFGRELPGFIWENTTQANALRHALGMMPGPPENQRRLSRFMRELNSSQSLSEEMRIWWANRY